MAISFLLDVSGLAVVNKELIPQPLLSGGRGERVLLWICFGLGAIGRFKRINVAADLSCEVGELLGHALLFAPVLGVFAQRGAYSLCSIEPLLPPEGFR